MARNGGVLKMHILTLSTVSGTCIGAATVQESLWNLILLRSRYQLRCHTLLLAVAVAVESSRVVAVEASSICLYILSLTLRVCIQEAVQQSCRLSLSRTEMKAKSIGNLMMAHLIYYLVVILYAILCSDIYYVDYKRESLACLSLKMEPKFPFSKPVLIFDGRVQLLVICQTGYVIFSVYLGMSTWKCVLCWCFEWGLGVAGLWLLNPFVSVLFICYDLYIILMRFYYQKMNYFHNFFPLYMPIELFPFSFNYLCVKIVLPFSKYS